MGCAASSNGPGGKKEMNTTEKCEYKLKEIWLFAFLSQTNVHMFGWLHFLVLSAWTLWLLFTLFTNVLTNDTKEKKTDLISLKFNIPRWNNYEYYVYTEIQFYSSWEWKANPIEYFVTIQRQLVRECLD